MKNFKLLLATTAILSMGAVNVKATDLSYTDSAEINASIELYRTNGISVIDEILNFGSLVSTGEHDDASVRLDATNMVRTITGSGVIATRTDDYHFARIRLYEPEGYSVALTMDSLILMNINDADEVTLVPEYWANGEMRIGDYHFREYTIGGSIDLSEAKFYGDYEGILTVTAVVSPEQTGGE